MGDYNRGGRSGGGRFRGRDFDRRDSGPREMHKAVCDECGKNCEVPFRPSGDKPIFCSDCFEKKNGGREKRSDRRGGGSNFAKGDNTNKQLLEQVTALNTKLAKILEILKPDLEEKPVSPKKEDRKSVV